MAELEEDPIVEEEEKESNYEKKIRLLKEQAKAQVYNANNSVEVTLPDETVVKGIFSVSQKLTDTLGNRMRPVESIRLTLFFDDAKDLEEGKSVVVINDKKYTTMWILRHSTLNLVDFVLASEK